MNIFRNIPGKIFLFCSLLSLSACGGGGGGSNGNDRPNPGTPPVEQAANEILETQDSARRIFSDLISQGDISAIDKTVIFLKQQSNIRDAQKGQDENSIWVRYNSGVEAIFISPKTMPNIETAERLLSQNTYRRPENNLNRKAIILLPVESKENYKDGAAKNVKEYLEQAGFSVTIKEDEQVTIDLMRTLSEYEIIYMSTHGAVGFWDLGWNIQIMTGEIADKTTMSKIWNALKAGFTSGITLFSPVGDSKTYFGLNENFFKHYTYQNSLVVMNACSSLKNDSLADAFLNKGARLYLGWDNPAFMDLGGYTFPDLFKKSLQTGVTILSAYNEVTAPIYPAQVYKDDNGNKEYRVRLKNGGEFGDSGDYSTDYQLSLKYKGAPTIVLNETPLPGVPEELYANAVSPNEINLSWKASTGDVIGYKVFRNGNYIKGVTGTSTSDINLSASSNYCYSVSAYNGTGESNQSDQRCISTPSPLSTSLLISPNSGPQGTAFHYSGSNYFPNGDVEWYVTKPDGTEFPFGILKDRVDYSGNFNYEYNTSCINMPGTYTIKAVDKSTSRESNVVYENVTINPDCGIEISSIIPSVATKNRWVTFTITGTGFMSGFTAKLINELNIEWPVSSIQYIDWYSVKVTVFLGTGPASFQKIRITNPDGHSDEVEFQAFAG